MLKNQVVLVTGAASGTAQAIALVAARDEGARFILSCPTSMNMRGKKLSSK